MISLLPRMKLNSKGWYKWAWGIVEGCTNDCWYCYAHDRIEGKGRDFTKLMFREELLDEPYHVRPSRIFINHLADIMLFPEEVINKILKVCNDLPEHEFIWMTKDPNMYRLYEFPRNCILGVTIETPEFWWRTSELWYSTARKMCSCEPILASFSGYDFSMFEFVVVGCLQGTEDHSNYDSVKHDKIYYTR
jgi:protein gp37